MVTTEFILYIVSVAFFIFIIMYYYNDTKKTTQPKQPIIRTQEEQVSSPNMTSGMQHGMMPGMVPGMTPGMLPNDPLRQFDYDAVNDDFTPPFRRSLYDDFTNYRLAPGLFPTYTRGPPGRFRKIGTLVAQGVNTNDQYKFLHLIGRERYVGRDFEYYAVSTNRENKIKFYVPTRGKEIFDDDIIVIDELEGYTFKFKEDIDLSPKYDPYFVS